jgi:hypothetical protein
MIYYPMQPYSAKPLFTGELPRIAHPSQPQTHRYNLIHTLSQNNEFQVV